MVEQQIFNLLALGSSPKRLTMTNYPRKHFFARGYKLRLCYNCGAGENELLTYCPGFLLNEDALDACVEGVVVDMFKWKAERKRK